MSVRTKLILIFLGLSVVPLALLTLFSYTNSIRSFRELVEKDNRAAAVDLQNRVTNLNGELRRRVEKVTELPEFERLDFSNRLQPEDADRLARAMRREVGESWDVLADLEFEADRSDAPSPPPLETARARPGPPLAPGVRSPEPPAPDDGTEEVASMEATDAEPGAGGDDDSYTMKIILPDFSQLLGDENAVPELKQYELDFVEGAPTEETMREMAAEMGDMLENLSYLSGLFVQTGGDGSIKLRNLADDARSELMALDSGAVDVESEVQMNRERRLAILERFDRATDELAQPFTLPVERGGERVGSIIARVRPDRMLTEVFRGTTLEEGEIVFAVDPLGRMHTRQKSDLETLQTLGLADAGDLGSGVMPAMAVTSDPEQLSAVIDDPDYITVIEKDEATGYTFGFVRRVAAELDEIQQATAMNLFLGLAFIGLAGSGVIVFSRRMTRGLELLTDGAHRIAGGDLDHRIDSGRRDEIGQLAVAFNDMAADLDVSRQRLVKQERLQRELEIARTIQRDSLPREGLSDGGVEIVGHSIPSNEVGGDFFNYLSLDDGRIAIVVGDVSGKGVPAALMMAEVQATFRTLLRYQDDPAAIITRLNRDLAGSKPANVYFTVFLGLLDLRAGELIYVNAAQNPPFLLHKNGVVEPLPSSTRPVGLYADSPVASATVRVQAGDLLCLYTDGVVESSARDTPEEFFGEERLVEIVRTAVNRPLADVLDEVSQRLTGFHGDEALEDDATLVVARIERPPACDRPDPARMASSVEDGTDLPVV